jgi:hypothetical protein
MTDHFFWRVREDRRRRATILLLTKTEDPPPSILPHLINGIPSLRGGTPKQSVDNLLNIKIRHCKQSGKQSIDFVINSLKTYSCNLVIH